MGKLDNKVVIVTGAASGMGKEIALLLASDDSSFVNGTILTVDGSWSAH